MDEELIFYTLAQLMAEVRWTRPGDTTPNTHRFVTVTRRLKLFSDVTAEQQPWIGQAEYSDNVAQITSMPYKSVLQANWVVYQCMGKDPNAIPTVENNCILNGIRAALAPKPTDYGFADKRNTLGGLVYHCFISGRVFKDPGNLDGQGMMVVPINLLVP